MTPRVALGAVMRNEWDFVLPWVSHHIQQGFGPLLVADNESDDGTLELLEALEEGGYVRLYRQPGSDGGIQVGAYMGLLETLAGDVSIIGFIDADEFVVSHDEVSAGERIARLFDAPGVGAVAVNWRLFGSAGRRFRNPVAPPSTACAPPWHPKHHYIKSFSRRQAIESVGPHDVSLAPGYGYVHVDGSRASQFCMTEDGWDGPFTAGPTGVVARIVMAPVTIHHHVLQDQTTFQLGKGGRPRSHFTGDQGPWQPVYFRKHDLNGDSCSAEMRTWVERQATEEGILAELRISTNLLKRFRVRVDVDGRDAAIRVEAPDGVNRPVRVEVRDGRDGWRPCIEIPVADFASGVATRRVEAQPRDPFNVRLKGVLDVRHA